MLRPIKDLLHCGVAVVTPFSRNREGCARTNGPHSIFSPSSAVVYYVKGHFILSKPQTGLASDCEEGRRTRCPRSLAVVMIIESVVIGRGSIFAENLCKAIILAFVQLSGYIY